MKFDIRVSYSFICSVTSMGQNLLILIHYVRLGHLCFVQGIKKPLDITNTTCLPLPEKWILWWHHIAFNVLRNWSDEHFYFLPWTFFVKKFDRLQPSWNYKFISIVVNFSRWPLALVLFYVLLCFLLLFGNEVKWKWMNKLPLLFIFLLLISQKSGHPYSCC